MIPIRDFAAEDTEKLLGKKKTKLFLGTPSSKFQIQEVWGQDLGSVFLKLFFFNLFSFIILFLFIYLFGYVGSLLLHAGFL